MPLYQRIDFLRNADGCIHIQMKMLRYNVFSCQEIYHGRLHFRQTVCAQPAKKAEQGNETPQSHGTGESAA